MSELHINADSVRLDDRNGGDGFVVILPPADEVGVFLTAPKPISPRIGGVFAIGATINGQDPIYANEFGLLNIVVTGGGGGTTPTLNQVTLVGNTTDQDIYFNIGASTKFVVNNGGGLPAIKTLNTNTISSSSTNLLPTQGGTLAISVNNQFADAAGNITIATGGGENLQETLNLGSNLIGSNVISGTGIIGNSLVFNNLNNLLFNTSLATGISDTRKEFNVRFDTNNILLKHLWSSPFLLYDTYVSIESSISVGNNSNILLQVKSDQFNNKAFINLSEQLVEFGVKQPGVAECKVQMNGTYPSGTYNLPISVNGVFANTVGNITIPTGITTETDPLAWKLLGNAGTVSGTNFLGTTDNIPLQFRVNNLSAGYIGIAPVYATTFGVLSMRPTVNTGIKNSAFGAGTLYNNTTGTGNSAFGYTSLYNNTTGNYNMGVGWATLGYNKTGNFNLAIGGGALNTSNAGETFGSGNTAIGYRALENLFTGDYNIGLGFQSGINKGGDSNTLFVSPNTTKMYMDLDTVVGQAPKVVGIDTNGFWHKYDAASGGGGSDTNFATTNLTSTGNRTHNFAGHELNILNSSILNLNTTNGSNASFSNYLYITPNEVQLRYDSGFSGTRSYLYADNAEIAMSCNRAGYSGSQIGFGGIYIQPMAVSMPSTSSVKVVMTQAGGARADLFFPFRLNNPNTTIKTFIPLSVNGEVADQNGNITIPTGGGAAVTANNGLAKSLDNIKLGGTLTENTTIEGLLFNLTINTTGIGANALTLESTNGAGLYSNGLSNGLTGRSPGGTGVTAQSVTGIALEALTGGGNLAGRFYGSGNDNSSITSIISVDNFSNIAPTAGFGAAINFNLQTSGGTGSSNKIKSSWINPTDATLTSQLTISGRNNGATQDVLQISGAGIFTLAQGLINHVDDAAASAGGIPVNGLYRTGSIVKIRVV